MSAAKSRREIGARLGLGAAAFVTSSSRRCQRKPPAVRTRFLARLVGKTAVLGSSAFSSWFTSLYTK